MNAGAGQAGLLNDVISVLSSSLIPISSRRRLYFPKFSLSGNCRGAAPALNGHLGYLRHGAGITGISQQSTCRKISRVLKAPVSGPLLTVRTVSFHLFSAHQRGPSNASPCAGPWGAQGPAMKGSPPAAEV